MRRITKLHPPTGVMYVEHSASQPVESLLVVDLAAEDNPLVLYQCRYGLCSRVFGFVRLEEAADAAERIDNIESLTLCDATRLDILEAVRQSIADWHKDVEL